jgi:hypothetical protein
MALHFPCRCSKPTRFARARDLEYWERQQGHPLDYPEKSKSYLLYRWADTLVHHPKVLDAVEDIIGPDILVYHSTMWIKEARTPAYVRWHQDGAYFFLDPLEHVTGWGRATPVARHGLPERGPPARIMIMSGPEARAPLTRHWSGAPPACPCSAGDLAGVACQTRSARSAPRRDILCDAACPSARDGR